MKKRLLLPILGLCLLTLGACGGNTDPAPMDAAELMGNIQESQSFTVELKALSQTQLLRYLGLEETQVSDTAMSIDASRATAEAIVVLTAASADRVQPLQEAVTRYRDELLEQYRDYQPGEVPKLEGAIIFTFGRQVVLAIGPDAAATEKVLQEVWK